jgi:diguanylate cyclase (GGDEF)-like protein
MFIKDIRMNESKEVHWFSKRNIWSYKNTDSYIRYNFLAVEKSNILSFQILMGFMFVIGLSMEIVCNIRINQEGYGAYRIPYLFDTVITGLGLLHAFYLLPEHPSHTTIVMRCFVLALTVFVFWERFFTDKYATDFVYVSHCILISILLIDKRKIMNGYIIVLTVVYSAVKIIMFGFDGVSLFTNLLLLVVYIIAGEDARYIKTSLLENNRIYEMQRDTDVLTGLPNRRKLYEELDQKQKASSERLEAVYMVDIDLFKNFNDTYGHQAGDDCLHRIGSSLNSVGLLTGIDFFRYGGEEFIGLVRAKNMHGYVTDISSFPFEENAQKLLDEIRSLEIPCNVAFSPVVTVSCGYAVAPKDEISSREALLEMADEALYQAKERGRNQFVQYKKP